MSEVAALLGGTSRVLMAASLADASHQGQVGALIVQAIELAAQIPRTIAAQQDATTAERRAAEAIRQAAEMAAAGRGGGGWQFTRSGTEVIEAARQARAAGTQVLVDQLPAVAEPGIGPYEPAR
jgi:hypothetical protein